MYKFRNGTAWLLTATMTAVSAGVMPVNVLAEGESNTAEITYNYDGENHTRQMEKLGRGLVAVKTNEGVFLSWRLLGTESSVGNIINAPDFKVYRNGSLLQTIDNSTNYLDTDGQESDTYSVAPVPKEGAEGERCAEVSVIGKKYFDIVLDKPDAFVVDAETSYSYSAGDCSCGDLDGDGEYEIVVKWEANPQDNSNGGITGNVILDAYKMDGTKLWRIDLGRNIRAGAHYTQFLVYDFDLDGKAEITCKTAPGSKDGNGDYVSAASADTTIQSADNSASYVNDGGYILEGPEYFTIFDGESGAAIDTINYPVQRVSAAVWGDSYGNRCDRFVADVSYMDGEKPYAVYWRGYYFGQSGYGSRTGVFAASFDGERLSVPDNHIFDTRSDQPGYRSGNDRYIGQGNHNMTTADVDDDGKDEVISGALCLELDDNDILSPKWCTFKEHGDALHIGDYDPTHKGLEFFTIHEDGNGVNTYGGVTLDYGASVIDPATGEIMRHWSGSKDTGRGLMANVGAGGYYQITATAGILGWNCLGGGSFEQGTAIGYNFRVFWDGDLYDETLDGTTISSWSGKGMESVFTADGCVSINGTKANPALQADLFGDWREEVVYPLADSSALRVYTTTTVTDYKLPTLMHDPVYRAGVAAEQSAYNQPPHIGFYLADEIYRPAVDYIEITKLPEKTEYLIGDSLDLTGMEVIAHFTDSSSDTITSYVVTGYDPTIAAEQEITVTYGEKTTSFKVKVKSGFIINTDGYITGYELNNESAILPELIDGITVKGFADEALKNSSLKSITITAEKMQFGNDVFTDGITIIGYLGSDAYVYANENGIDYQVIDTREYSASITYDESSYSGWSVRQAGTSQTYQIGHVIYGVGGRMSKGKPAGDGVSGFTVNNSGDAFIDCSVGRFSDNNRNSYFTLSDIPMTSSAADNVFETDIKFINNAGRTAQMIVKDSNGVVVDTVSAAALSAEYDAWYTYKLIYHNGEYYRAFGEKGEDAAPVFVASAVSEYGMSRFDFTTAPDSSSIGNDQSANIYLDNTKVYTNAEIGKLTLNIVDKNENQITDAAVTIDGEAYVVNRSGAVVAELCVGMYDVTVKADGYDEKKLSIGVFKNAVEKTVVLENEYTAIEGVQFEKDALSLKVGQIGQVKAVTIPANATEQGIEYSSSDEAIAVVDNDGKVTATAPGEVVITAKSTYNNAITAECNIKVYEDNYISEVQTIEILTPEKAYITNNGVPNEVELNAKAYDQNGVAMDAAFTWSANVQKASLKDGKLILPSTVKPGGYTLTAKAGTVSASKTIELMPLNEGADVIAEEKLESSLSLTMGTEDKTVTIDDITYHSGARGGGGDNKSGFYIGNLSGRTVLRATAGRFASADREAYFTFDKVTAASVYEPGVDYVFETDIYFDSPTKMNLCAYSDTRGKALMQIDVGTLGLEKQKWYHYMLIYSGGSYEHYAIDENGNFVNIPAPVVSGSEMIGQVHFVLGDTEGSIYLAGTKFYSTKSAYSDIILKAVDRSGTAVPNAWADVAGIVKTTDSNGRAIITLPLGIYNVSVNSGNLTKSTPVIANGANSTYIIRLAPSAIEEVNGGNITVTAAEDGLKLYAAQYSDDVLLGIKVMDVSEGTYTYNAGITPDKVFLWDSSMKAVDSYTIE